MLNERRIKEAHSNVKRYLSENLLKKQKNETAKEMFIDNSNLSLKTAQKLLSLESFNYKPYLWIIVCSYYSMYYIANAVLLNLGYKVGDKISHKITVDALIVFVRNKLKRELIEDYEEVKESAQELIVSKTDSILEFLDLERKKRSKFQYQTDEKIKKARALTSLKRAKQFVFEMKKLL